MRITTPVQQASQQKNQAEPVSQRLSTVVDARPQALMHRQIQERANNSPQAVAQAQLQKKADNSPQARQLKAHSDLLQARPTTAQRQVQQTAPASTANKTGMPNQLKTGIESLSGMSMDHVRVHYNSAQPAQLNAHAYAQGSDIHVAPGQEKHLPHEAWHVVQQAQGRVRPTMQMKGATPVNDDTGLEAEADVMGARALQMAAMPVTEGISPNFMQANNVAPVGKGSVQRKLMIGSEPYSYQEDTEKVHNTAPDKESSFIPLVKPKAKEWSSDAWKRQYTNVGEFQNHISGQPVNCGLFPSLGLWYRLPFNPGTPFVLAENHETKVTSIMTESNRKGSILHEGNGVIPIKSKNAAQKPDDPAGFHKTAMESVIAKTLFGVTFHPAAKMKPAKKAEHETELSSVWLGKYANARVKGKDVHQRPYYQNERGVKVILGENSDVAYSSINSMLRVKAQFDEEADKYIKANEVAKPVPANYVKGTKAALNLWWAAMLEVKDLYAAPVEDAEAIKNKGSEIATLRKKLIPKLKNLFNEEYKDEIGGLEKRKDAVSLKGLNAEMVETLAMRDLAMLTVILNKKKDGWGDHEMIAMGFEHVKNLHTPLTDEAELQVITREKFISDSESAL
ncbi:eCIS core domain-containing protein [Undibacterium hunanense]|uniref:eCIS core domain-containing protein n=1 Tax=Undibacterium hunanense TaxID=2762292 RepID=UPI001E298CE0|nr:DUF4157 domain-containing protein [Undibacterium hunanense]